MKKVIIGIAIAILTIWLPVNAKEEFVPVGPTAILIDITSGSILYEKNSAEHYDTAELSELMTVYMAVENLPPSKLLTMSSSAFQSYNHNHGVLWIQQEETISLEDALHATILDGYNDTVALLAEAVSGSVEQHVADLNQFCQELGMADTKIKNCFGLQDAEQFTTAKDLGIFMRKALHDEIFSSVFAKQSYTINETNKMDQKRTVINTSSLWNHEQLKDILIGTKQVKNDQGYVSLIAAVKREETELLAIVLAEADEKDAQSDIVGMLNYGLNAYRTVTMQSDLIETKTIEVHRDQKHIADVKFSLSGDLKLLLPPEIDLEKIQTEILVEHEDATNPDDILAYVLLKLDDKVLGKVMMKKDVVLHDTSFKAVTLPKIILVFDLFSVFVLAVFIIRDIILKLRHAMATPQ